MRPKKKGAVIYTLLVKINKTPLKDGKACYVTRTGARCNSLVLSYVSDILLYYGSREID